MDTLNLLKDTLYSCVKAREADFSGLGVLVYSSFKNLPVVGMREKYSEIGAYSSSELLARVSTTRSKYHDGFHLLSHDCKLTHLSQYFSPPIVRSIQLPNTNDFGGRYVAALFGSTINEVEFSAIVNTNIDLSIFRNGMCICSERLS